MLYKLKSLFIILFILIGCEDPGLVGKGNGRRILEYNSNLTIGDIALEVSGNFRKDNAIKYSIVLTNVDFTDEINAFLNRDRYSDEGVEFDSKFYGFELDLPYVVTITNLSTRIFSDIRIGVRFGEVFEQFGSYSDGTTFRYLTVSRPIASSVIRISQSVQFVFVEDGSVGVRD